jgi:hypothetical protein
MAHRMDDHGSLLDMAQTPVTKSIAVYPSVHNCSIGPRLLVLGEDTKKLRE